MVLHGLITTCWFIYHIHLSLNNLNSHYIKSWYVLYVHDNLDIYIQSHCMWMVLEHIQRSSGVAQWVNPEMHLEAVIKGVWKCIWRPRLSELRDAHGGRNSASVEMPYVASIERTWRPWLCNVTVWPTSNDQLNVNDVIGLVNRCN